MCRTAHEHLAHLHLAESLKKFTSLSESTLEKTEKLEQLRALENGMTIHTCIVDSSLKPISIDTQEDLNRAINLMKKKDFPSTERYKKLAESLKQNMGRRKL